MGIYDDKRKKTEDYYADLEQQNFRSLLDSQIQLENARQRAVRQTNVGLAAAGMDSSGYSGSVRGNIENQYLSALQQHQQNFNQQNAELQRQKQADLSNIDEAEYNEQNTRIASIVNDWKSEGGTEPSSLYETMANGGYGTYDASTGKFTWNEDLGLSQSDISYLDTLIRMGQTTSESSSEEVGSAIPTGESEKVSYVDEKGNFHQQELKKVFKNESEATYAAIQTGKIPTGSYIQMVNGWGDKIYAKVGSDGRLYYISQSAYDAADPDKSYVVNKHQQIAAKSDKAAFDQVLNASKK